jgi:peptidoglycan-associated lipoprotein
MKLNRFILPMVLPLAIVLATPGCGHKYGKGTNPPKPAQTGLYQPPDLTTRPISQPDNTATASAIPTPPPYAGGPIGTATNWDPAAMNQDPEKLAAYTVHFKFDSSVVEENEHGNVASVEEALKTDANAKLLIAGHCDERGTEEYNRSLGERRALALRETLAKDGIDAERIRTISFGKDQPADPGHDESAWAKNRRGQFIYCTPKTAAP